jgi:peroxiredoxin Q/BCP
LLCDTGKSLARDYGVLGFGFTSRVTFLIDKEGTIRRVWKKVKPAGHAAEVIDELRVL